MPGPSPIANQFRSNFGEQRGGGTPLAKSLGSAGNDTGNASELFFPGDVEQLDHWCAIRIFKQQLMQRKDTPIKNDIARVFLPMPQQLTTGYNHGYNAESLGPAGAVGASLGAAAAPWFTGIPYVGWLAAGWISLLGGKIGSEAGSTVGSVFNDC